MERHSGVEGWARRLEGQAGSVAAVPVKSTPALPIELRLEAWG